MKFIVTYEASVELEISDALIENCMTEDWQAACNKLTAEKIAAHIGYNVLRNNVTDVSQLDGFADRPATDMQVLREDWDLEESRKL